MDSPKRVVRIYIFIFFITGIIKNVVSQPSSSQCPLNFTDLTTPQNSSCEERGTWGGFLRDKCCKGPFHDYLYALAWHANQTGEIYLKSTEQLGCLRTMKDNGTDVLGCGIEKLTSGGGGCSNFLVKDVSIDLGGELISLQDGCRFMSSGRGSEWSESCDHCIRTWEGIKGIKPGDSLDNDLCRFAVLTSLTSSKIHDLTWMQNVHRCLGEQDINEDIEDKDGTEGRKKNITGPHILIGVLSGSSAIIVLYVYIMSRRWYKSHPPAAEEGLKQRALPKKAQYLKVPIKEVHYATNNLNQLNFIGEGTAGKVYKGILSNKQHVAVKHIINDGFLETFLREVRNVALVRHPNLVALLGYCDNGDECFLIYELCANGNLSEWLFGKDKVLSWIQRLEIAIDSARGLWYLHTYSEGCIVHRDIKPTNILLGPNFEAKLSDFGLSKVIDIGETYESSEVRGTFGYVDPEYRNDHQVNPASDVYSFGVVLLQILSGKKVMNMNARKPMPLEKVAKSLTKDGSIGGFADPKLEGEYSLEAFELIFKLALSCTGLKQQRPSMEQVVKKLEKAHDMSISASASHPHSTPDWSSTP